MNLHRENVKETTEMFGEPKGRQFSANAARCGKYRSNLKNKLSTCPYTALAYMKYSRIYANSILSIAMDPFHVIYGSPNQFALLKAYYQQNKSNTKISCDATGSIVNRLGKF